MTGLADVYQGVVTLHIDETRVNELEKGQKVYIADQEGEILSITNSEPVVSTFTLEDGKYDYYIVTKEVRPIDFLLK